jgi:hypothetical protein
MRNAIHVDTGIFWLRTSVKKYVNAKTFKILDIAKSKKLQEKP